MFSQTRVKSPDYLVSADRWLTVELRCCKHTVPVGNVLVGDAGRHIEHDDAALAVDIVTVTKTAKLLLARSVPDIELDRAKVLECLLASNRRGAHARWKRLTVLKPRG